MWARTGRARRTRPARCPPGTGRAGASRGRRGHGCGAWPGPGRLHAGSSARWREPAGGARPRPAPRGSPGGLVPAPGPGPAAVPGRRGVHWNSATAGPGSEGRSVQRRGPSAGTLIHHTLQAGGRAEGAVDWGLGTGAQGNRPWRACADLCTHMRVQACQPGNGTCALQHLSLPGGPGHGPGWGGGVGGAGGGGPTCRSRPARSSSGPSTRTRVTARVPPWPGGCSGLLLGFGASALSAKKKRRCQ